MHSGPDTTPLNEVICGATLFREGDVVTWFCRREKKKKTGRIEMIVKSALGDHRATVKTREGNEHVGLLLCSRIPCNS
jgi:hypothetical protein